jgi:uncharacterized membrane protein
MEQEKNNLNNSKSNNNEMWGIFAYIFFAIPLIFANEKTPFIKFHTNQSLILFLFFIIGNILLNILGFYYSPIGMVFKVFCIALFVVGIVNVTQNRTKSLPLIGEWANFIK